MTTKPDRAVLTAREILDDTVCECGCTESAHVFDPDACHGDGGEPCPEECREFRPVRFRVERVSPNEQ